MNKHIMSMGAGLLCLLLTTTARAQLRIGLSAGATRNYLHTNSGPFFFAKYSPADGFGVNLPIQYAITDWLAVQTEAQFIQKNSRLTRTGYYEGIHTNTTNQYMQVPVMGHFSFGGRQLKGFLNLGGYIGYWTTSRQQGIMANIDNDTDIDNPERLLDELSPLAYDNSYTFDTRKDRRLELGWLTGIGLTYQPGRYQFFVEGRYTQALLDQHRPYMINQIPVYNQTYSLQVGCLYQLSTRRHPL
jgi:hypothetical protein